MSEKTRIMELEAENMLLKDDILAIKTFCCLKPKENCVKCSKLPKKRSK